MENGNKMIEAKHAMQIHRNYEMFKEAIGKLCNRTSLTDEQKDKYYLFAKAELYNIDITDFIYNLEGLQQAVDIVENLELSTNNTMRYYG